MNREQLADVLRAASQLVDDRPLVMGSQAILGTYEEDVLPPDATMSMEADVAFLDDRDRAKADLVTGAIGEDSDFHQLRGYYAEGIHVETATLPDRLARQADHPAGCSRTERTRGGRLLLERHDLVRGQAGRLPREGRQVRDRTCRGRTRRPPDRPGTTRQHRSPPSG